MSKLEFQTDRHATDADPQGASLASEEARVQQRLAEAIYEHRIPSGTKLPEADLCRILGTSRGTLRKVLDRLADEQLVEQIPNRGAFVARPSIETTRDVYALRRILEAGVVRSLARCDCKPWINKVRLQVGEEREANRVGDTSRYIRLAGKFHLDLAAATGNQALNQHLKRVVAQTSLMTALYDVPGTNTCSVHEHLEILEAIEAGRLEDAERLMEDHLKGCERQLRLGDEPPAVDLSQALGGLATMPAGTAGRISTKTSGKASSQAVPARKTPARRKPRAGAGQ
ncbi:GntR family transcriptional regulator [Polaromonas sp.]|uniref:GntR family transcriptional regulator n=1 Tax=Polaromonas sp. TaxID=1869339 RepID=UPI00286BB916|nr:GntR family transcriptional regulator [Polaromonas sp.]